MTQRTKPAVRIPSLVAAVALALVSPFLVLSLGVAVVAAWFDAWLTRHLLRAASIQVAISGMVMGMAILAGKVPPAHDLASALAVVALVVLLFLCLSLGMFVPMLWALLDPPVGPARPLPPTSRGLRYLFRLRGGTELLSPPPVRTPYTLPDVPTRVDHARPRAEDVTEWVRTTGGPVPDPPRLAPVLRGRPG